MKTTVRVKGVTPSVKDLRVKKNKIQILRKIPEFYPRAQLVCLPGF